MSCLELCDVVGGLPVNSCQCCVPISHSIPSLSYSSVCCLCWQLFALRYAAHLKSERETEWRGPRTTNPQVEADAAVDVADVEAVAVAGAKARQKAL